MKEKIYLIPGLMTDHRLWNRITPLLEEKYELVHISIPHNENFDEIVDHLHEIFEEPNINLLGFSLGSYVASYFAIKYPNRVKRLFNVAGTPSGTTINEVQKRRKKLDYIHVNGFKELGYEKTVSLLEVENQDDEELIQLIQDMYNELGKDVFITQLESTFHRKDLLEDLEALALPVWFFLSLEDRLLNSESLKLLQNRKHDMNIIVREGTSHMIPLEEPEDLCGYIDEWMRSENLSLILPKEHPCL